MACIFRQHVSHAQTNNSLQTSAKASESTSLLDQIFSHLNSGDLVKAKVALIKFNGKDTKTFEAAILRGEVQCYSLKELESGKKSESVRDKICKSICTAYVNTGTMRSLTALCIGRAIRSFFRKNFKIRTKTGRDGVQRVNQSHVRKAVARIQSKDYKSVGPAGVFSPMSLAYIYCVKDVAALLTDSGLAKFEHDINTKQYFYTAKDITKAEGLAFFKQLKELANARVFYRPIDYVYLEHSSKLVKSETKTVPMLRQHAEKFIFPMFLKHFDASPLGSRADSDALRKLLKDFESIIVDDILQAILPEPDSSVQEQNRISER